VPHKYQILIVHHCINVSCNVSFAIAFQIEESERRQKALLDIMRKDLTHQERLVGPMTRNEYITLHYHSVLIYYLLGDGILFVM